LKLIYCYDALCGWCYGFAPVIEQFAQEHADDFEIEVLSGGMITGERIGPIGEVAGYIGEAYKDVERATGITFGKAFLEGTLAEGSAIFTSIPPAIALSTFKTLAPDHALDYAGALQRAIYQAGVEPTDMAAFAERATAFGVDRAALLERSRGNEITLAAEADFERVRQFGVSGFPTVILQAEDKYYLLTRGYTDGATLEQRWAHLQNEILV
jgi:putative protein-disulfide isomerase